VLLCTSAALVEAVRLSSLSALSNGDLWWHLRTGLWILQNHALPHSGLFSQMSDRPWIVSSWGYDLLLAGAYRLLDLRAVPALLMCLKVGLAVLVFWLADGWRGKFWPAVGLSAVAQYILAGVQPGPAYWSVLLFAVELMVLNEARRTGSLRPLFWLPPLFLVWANLDVQFVYGIVLLLLFLTVTSAAKAAHEDATLTAALKRCATPNDGTTQVQSILATGGAAAVLSVIATLITPYFYRSYGVFFSSMWSAANRYLPDFHAMSFHQPRDYVALLLTMGAFLALGLRRSRDLYLISLLAVSAMLSFHAQRDIWLATLAAVAVIADTIRGESNVAAIDDRRAWRQHALVTAGLVILVLILACGLQIPRGRETLLAKIGQSYPVAACDYIRQHQLSPPVFNAYEWGGFLTWYLPEYPVAIDGRTDLYGDDFIIQYSKVMNADLPYTINPALTGARTILLPRGSLMAEALGTVPGFTVAYSDNVAVVLTRP